MSADVLVSRLERVRQGGRGRWTARCPAHEDKGPSLSVRELDDGRVLLHCFGGCEVSDVLAAVGLEMADLFPERATAHAVPRDRRPPFDARAVLRCIAHEVTIARLCSIAMRQGEALSDEDDERLALCMTRLIAAEAIANGD